MSVWWNRKYSSSAKRSHYCCLKYSLYILSTSTKSPKCPFPSFFHLKAAVTLLEPQTRGNHSLQSSQHTHLCTVIPLCLRQKALFLQPSSQTSSKQSIHLLPWPFAFRNASLEFHVHSDSVLSDLLPLPYISHNHRAVLCLCCQTWKDQSTQRSKPVIIFSYCSARRSGRSTLVLIIKAECKTCYEVRNYNLSLLLMADFLYSKYIERNILGGFF